MYSTLLPEVGLDDFPLCQYFERKVIPYLAELKISRFLTVLFLWMGVRKRRQISGNV